MAEKWASTEFPATLWLAVSGITADVASLGYRIPFSVSELVDVIEESVKRVGGLVGVGAVEGALAGLDHHHVLVKGLAILTVKLDTHRAGLLWATAAAVYAGAAVFGSVLLQAGAACVGEFHCLSRLLGSVALFPFLFLERIILG